VTEAVAAMGLAACHGVRVGVIAVVEHGRLDGSDRGALQRACPPERPAVCVSWIASHHLAGVYWAVRPVPTTHLGYRERWGPTPWETLEANGLTRWALLNHLRAAGCPLPATLDRDWAAELEQLDPHALNCEVRRL
jgi:hypothetical protein